MPERSKNEDLVARILVDADPRRFTDKLGSIPDGVDADVWDDAQISADRIVVDVVENTDWNRVLIEAHQRHSELHPDASALHMEPDIGMATVAGVCGPCLREALLALDTRPDWADQPESPRHLRWEDPAVHGELIVPPGFEL